MLWQVREVLHPFACFFLYGQSTHVFFCCFLALPWWALFLCFFNIIVLIAHTCSFNLGPNEMGKVNSKMSCFTSEWTVTLQKNVFWFQSQCLIVFNSSWKLQATFWKVDVISKFYPPKLNFRYGSCVLHCCWNSCPINIKMMFTFCKLLLKWANQDHLPQKLPCLGWYLRHSKVLKTKRCSQALWFLVANVLHIPSNYEKTDEDVSHKGFFEQTGILPETRGSDGSNVFSLSFLFTEGAPCIWC